jgi:hypothetical protein
MIMKTFIFPREQNVKECDGLIEGNKPIVGVKKTTLLSENFQKSCEC